ncbi:MocR-like pyridoxine biosynthesis transcription factor PdxR [Bacillus sp. T33-2]|uniref:MocR-like pyridoxine biosynthesis transcription factor PdxR n=1 Tax=Bacillus sp. T33-2 TaxID=2054168 RepID=UPI000C7590FE|nr:PLP-dependent aminotransferase family protein [Bacillus sp. T33-2]PLR97549.1 PLP-dependent aminotransferase family protein [Bacillus sp. T33-2]
MELLPILDRERKESLYIQLYHFLKNAIETGELSAGQKIPSIRQLSTALNISKNTVESAYQQLIAEGYMESKPRSGIEVAVIDEMAGNVGISYHEGEQKAPESVSVLYDFQYGDIEETRFPYAKWKKALNEAVRMNGHEMLLYGEKQGDPGLRKQIADYLYRARGVECSPGQIVLCAGTQHTISYICQMLSLPGKTVGFEDPGYDGVRAVFQNHGCNVVPVSLEEDGINIAKLAASQAEMVYVTPSHQFPLGMVMPVQKRNRLLQWAADAESYIIEDDYDSEFRYQGQPVPSLKSLDKQGRVIYLGTFSKAFLPGTRLSYLVLPEQILRLYQSKMANYNQAVPPVIQNALSLFIQNGDFERHIRKMRKIYQDKHKTLLSEISRQFGDNCEVIGQKAGLHILLDVKGRCKRDLIEKAMSVHVRVYDPAKYWLDEEECPGSLIMLGFGGLSTSQIAEGIVRLKEIWNLENN